MFSNSKGTKGYDKAWLEKHFEQQDDGTFDVYSHGIRVTASGPYASGWAGTLYYMEGNPDEAKSTRKELMALFDEQASSPRKSSKGAPWEEDGEDELELRTYKESQVCAANPNAKGWKDCVEELGVGYWLPGGHLLKGRTKNGVEIQWRA